MRLYRWFPTLCLVLPIVVLGMMGSSSAVPQPGSPAPQKRALLVAVGAYAPGTGWETLAAETDLELVSEALSHHGFEASAIRFLSGSEATRSGILQAIADHLLAPAQPGDVLVLFLSGHGQRLTDGADADELDGYDEAFVPWDAPKTPHGNYRGEKHLRDDELGEVLDRLRRKVGANGEVLVLLDSCFSGTGTRGDAAVRGGPALGPPRSPGVAEGKEEGSGFREPGREEELPHAGGLAPQIVLTAARSDEAAYETKTVDGRPVGPLSRAFARSLLAPGLDPTYRGLAEEIRWEMASYLLPHQPQAEGDLDQGLFGGAAMRAERYLRISKLDEERRRLTVRPGALIGLELGAEVEVHAPGTVTPSPTTRLAVGRVERATYAEATIGLSAPLESERPTACRVFVTRYSFGDLQMRVELVGSSEASLRSSPLTASLEDIPAVRLVRDHPDFRITQEPVIEPGSDRNSAGNEWVIREAASGEVVARAPSGHPVPDESLVERLRSLARNRYLRRVNQYDPRFHVGFEIVPVEITGCPELLEPSLQECTVVPLVAKKPRNLAGLLELPLGTYFQLRITPGKRAAYGTVLDLMPDGQIEVLWPPRGQEEQVQPGEPRLLQMLYRTVEPRGLDQLLLIASEEYLDFWPFRWLEKMDSKRGSEDLGQLRLGPFEPLFDDLTLRTRSRAVFIEAGRVSTASVTMRVVP